MKKESHENNSARLSARTWVNKEERTFHIIFPQFESNGKDTGNRVYFTTELMNQDNNNKNPP